MRKYAFVFLFFLCGIPFFAQEIYDNFLHFKAALYNAESVDVLQTILIAYGEKLEKNSTLTEEEAITLRTLYALEKALFEEDAQGKKNAKDSYLILSKQHTACREFMEHKKIQEINPWLITGWADVKSRLTAFLSGQDRYTEATNAQNLYLAALKKDKTFSSGYLSYGLWLFFAPPIAGGGEEPALKEFSKAVVYAKNAYEKYFALLYRSQIYESLENKEKAAADLAAAHALLPDERFTALVIEGNKHGKLFFE